MKEKTHPSLCVSKEIYRRQLKAVSTLPLGKLINWLEEELTTEVLAADIQLRLAKRKEVYIRALIAKDKNLLPRSFRELIKAENQDIQRLLADNPAVDEEMARELLATTKRFRSFGWIFLRPGNSKEFRTEVNDKAQEVLAPEVHSLWRYSIAAMHASLTEEEFDSLTEGAPDSWYENFISSESLPVSWKQKVLAEGKTEHLYLLAKNESITLEEAKRLVSFNISAITAQILCNFSIADEYVSELTRKPLDFNCYIPALYFRPEIFTKEAIGSIIARSSAEEMGDHLAAVIERVPELENSFIEDCLNGVYGTGCQAFVLMRKEISTERLDEMLLNEEDISSKGDALWYAVRNPNASLNLINLASKQNGNWELISIVNHRQEEFNEDMNWSFIRVYLPLSKEHGPKIIVQYIEDNFGEEGRNFLEVMKNSGLSLRELKESYSRL